MIVNREIAKAIQLMLEKYPVITLTGPRQSGKTTLLKTILPGYQYVSLENPDNRYFAQTDPNGFLKKYASSVIIDEAQQVPSLFSYIQTILDESGKMGQFILSGSQNFHLMQNISQSLAGRVAIFKLFPFDIQELKAANFLQSDYLVNMVRGFYPAIYDRDIPSDVFYSNYVQTYVQRDLSQLIAIKDLRIFRKFLGLCASRAGQLLNMNSLGNECGISQPTVKSWISALESSYIIFMLQPFHENFSKRIVKTPKLYFYDTGLLCHLLKITDHEQILTHSFKGSLFENMMVAEYFKRMYHKNKLNDIWFWRDSSGNEVDMIEQTGTKLKLTEFKSTQTVMPDLFKGFRYFEQHSKVKYLEKTLVYTGSDSSKRTEADILSWADFGK
jgi:predicted AAA+ superfamily ATPase